MLAEERQSMPCAQLSRRKLFGAAAAIIAIPAAAAAAQPPDLTAIHRQYEAARESYNALPIVTPEEEDFHFSEIVRLDNVIAPSPRPERAWRLSPGLRQHPAHARPQARRILGLIRLAAELVGAPDLVWSPADWGSPMSLNGVLPTRAAGVRPSEHRHPLTPTGAAI